MSLFLFFFCSLHIIITRGTTSQRLGSIFFSFFFFFHVAISDSVQWLPYLGFVPGPTRTTSKGLMSLLLSLISLTLLDKIHNWHCTSYHSWQLPRKITFFCFCLALFCAFVRGLSISFPFSAEPSMKFNSSSTVLWSAMCGELFLFSAAGMSLGCEEKRKLLISVVIAFDECGTSWLKENWMLKLPICVWIYWYSRLTLWSFFLN